MGRLRRTCSAPRGLPADADDGDPRVAASRSRTTARTYADVWELAEALLQHDELAADWRARHVTMVERMIGTQVRHRRLERARRTSASRLPLRYYPLLWELRSQL